MEGDPRNVRVSLLKKYDIPVDHLSYEYVEKCTDKKELERIIRILRSGEEGSYPDLLKRTEERLRLFAPDSRVLRVEVPILTKEALPNEEWSAVEKDLLTWEEDIKVMDKCLEFEKDRIEVIGNHKTPGVRKVVQSTSKSEPKAAKAVKLTNKKDRIRSGDYAAWDKFDVDKELLKIDVEEERMQEENEKKKREVKKQTKEKKIELMDVNKESYSTMEQQVLANQAKDRGNECYRAGDLETALKYYEISIKLHPTANGYNNRAITYLKLKQYENALNDCNKVLELDKDNIKGLHRRATAYQNLSSENYNYNELALRDLNKIVLIEPNNKTAQSDLQALKKKLNIQDEGKKFRMPIFESENTCKEMDEKRDEAEEKSLWNVKDCFVDKLPLTYYGPSTSTFQCEPYSMAHRALSSGAVFSGQVLCKCNSNRGRQNPLCQKCGEEMSKPKRVYKAVKGSPKKDVVSITKKDNEARNQLIKQQEHKSLMSDAYRDSNKLLRPNRCEFKIEEVDNSVEEPKEKLHEGEQGHDENKNGDAEISIKSNTTSKRNEVENEGCKEGVSNDKSAVNVESTIVDKSVYDDEVEVSEENHRKTNELNLSSESLLNDKTPTPSTDEGNKLVENKLENPERPSKVENVNSDIDVGAVPEKVSNNDVSSVQSDERPVWKKSKNKKKSKETKETKIRKYPEPIKVVHAAKYLHPTSVEPKLKNEICKESQSATGNCSFKAFVPNKKSLSEHGVRLECSSESGSGNNRRTSECVENNFEKIERIKSELSLEGNKENISGNTSQCNKSEVRTGKEVSDEEMKKEKIESAFEFIRSWEELKKMDVTYAKRAEIIRLIKPSDLRKVIGIKLDSEILSSLLECWERHFIESDPKIVLEFLKHLPELPRFGLVSMFLGEKEKKVMKRLVETAEGKGFTLDEDVKKALTISS